jgi:hypothetical protein
VNELKHITILRVLLLAIAIAALVAQIKGGMSPLGFSRGG